MRGMFRVKFLSYLIRFCSGGTTHPIDRTIRSLLSSKMVRLYTTELEPQLSPDLIKIMDQRLSAIKHRNVVLQKLINKPEYSPAEFSRTNKELRKLRESMELINDLRAKQKEIEGLKSLVTESSEDKDILDMAVSELDEAVEEHHQASRVIGIGMFGCGSDIVEREDFIAENITFENSAPEVCFSCS